MFTIKEMKEHLQKLEDIGLGNLEITIPIDDYNDFATSIDRLEFRPTINCITVCTHNTYNLGINTASIIE